MRSGFSVLVLGLSLSSSWGNGHATTYRALLRGLAERGHHIRFLERDVPWYADNRDLTDPGFCDLSFYSSLPDLRRRFGTAIAGADVVIVGSYVPEGVELIDLVFELAQGIIAFYDIDTPVTCAKLERDEAGYIATRQVPGFDLYLSFSGGPILRHIERRFGAKRAKALYCAVDAELYRPDRHSKIRWDLGYIGTYSADRQPVLERLLVEPARRLPQYRFVVAGPQYPPEIRWPDNVTHIEHLPPAEHRSFYNGLRFALNATRADMIAAGWSPSVRLFEAAACGTPIISDRWEGLSAFLPEDSAILVAQSSDDMVAALTQVTDAERKKIVQQARRRVLQAHTGAARARELEEYLLSLPWPTELPYEFCTNKAGVDEACVSD